MKLIRVGPSGKMVQIGDDSNHSEWYVIEKNVQPFIAKLQVGDEVTIKFEKRNGGKNHLTWITKGNGAVAQATLPQEGGGEPVTPAPQNRWGNKSSSTTTGAPKTYGKSPAEQDSIKRQAIGNMTSRTLISLQGQVNPENVDGLIEQIYAKYVELVG